MLRLRFHLKIKVYYKGPVFRYEASVHISRSSIDITGLEVIKLEFILKLKIKCNDWLLVDTCPQATNRYAFFEFETVLKFYNLEASSSKGFVFIYKYSAGTRMKKSCTDKEPIY